MKLCSKCELFRLKQEFSKHKTTKDGYNAWCKSCIRFYGSMWRKKNGEKQRKAIKIWKKNNLKKYRKTENERAKIRRKIDINYKLKKYLRTRIWCGVKNKYSSKNYLNYIGCSIEELKVYLESKFVEGMTWENYSHKIWHIDHIVPLASFDLTDLEQFKKACHYTNLQPLWAKDNLKKGAKI